MELALIVLAAAVVVAAADSGFRPAQGTAPEPARRIPRLDEVMSRPGRDRRTVRADHRGAEALSDPGERLKLDKRLGESLKENATKTAETLGGIQARLTVIDEAQKNISALSGQVVSAAADSFQQAGARRLRPGADGRDRRDGLPPVALRFPVHAFQRQPARLRHPHSRQQGAAGDRCQISAGRL